MLDLMRNYLFNWLSFNALGEVFNGHNELLHMTYCQMGKCLKCISPMYGRTMSYKSIAASRLMHDTNQRASSIAHSVGHISQNPPSSSTNNTQLRRLSTRELVFLCGYHKCLHGARPLCSALIPTYTCEDRVDIIVTKKVSINHSIPPCRTSRNPSPNNPWVVILGTFRVS